MNPILYAINLVIDVYFFFVVISIIISWLVHFNIINRYQPFVQQITVFLHQITNPVYQRIRRVLPPMSGIDLAPLVLLLGLKIVQYTINWGWVRVFG